MALASKTNFVGLVSNAQASALTCEDQALDWLSGQNTSLHSAVQPIHTASHSAAACSLRQSAAYNLTAGTTLDLDH